jgi:UDP-N-acetylmuramoyl-tripeptide--D-alanyl-D-alanine ligase
MSEPFTLGELARWTGGRTVRGAPGLALRGVSTDTRTLGDPDLLFVAIRGPNHDAHEHLTAALDAGAGALLVEREDALPESAAAAVVVDDTTRALGDLAAGHRSRFSGPVVGITGSNGKTSTKELCAAILERTGPCLRNRGNLNNLYGLPLTLLARESEHSTLVVELGTNQPGEIARLAEIARPTVGVITNVGTAHIEFLGSRDGIAHEKGSLLEALPADGVAVLNADDARVMAQRARTPATVRTFGLDASADVRAERLRRLDTGGFAFELVAPEGRCAIELRLLGDPAVCNALAAAAAALAAGANLEAVATGLAGAKAVGGRMQPLALAGGAIVVDDSYNANPQSTEAALRSLALLKGAGRGLAALGDMGELGDSAEDAHTEAGALAARLGLDFLFAVGAYGKALARGALGAGMAPDRVMVFADAEAAAVAIDERLRPRDWVLVKGSRAMRMERIVQALVRRRPSLDAARASGRGA